MGSETAPLATQDKLKAVQAQVEVGRGVMSENIHKQLDNIAASEDLEEGAAMLKGQSQAFKVDATKSRWQEMFKSWKFNLLIAAVALLIFAIFILPMFASSGDDGGDRRR